MVVMTPVKLSNRVVVGITVDMPKTRLICIQAGQGYIVCGLLDVDVVDELHPEREVIAGRAYGVRTVEELLNARLNAVTRKARELGIQEGMTGREALERMLQAEDGFGQSTESVAQ
jgi:uncharacterized protein YunC (DUF1805 family)